MTVLDDAQVAEALTSLCGWSGDSGRIARTVQVSAQDAETLRVTVMGVADEVDHHPVVEHHGTALTFVLWTHSMGGVTAKDIDLATRIDRVIEGD